MKKIVLIGALCAGVFANNLVDEAAKLDVKKVCDVKANGTAKVLEVAKKFNPEAVKLGVEFTRLGISNRAYIKYTEEAIKAKKKEVVIKYKVKGEEKTKKFPTDFAAWRACVFAIRALAQVKEAEKTWRLAIPGDGFKY